MTDLPQDPYLLVTTQTTTGQELLVAVPTEEVEDTANRFRAVLERMNEFDGGPVEVSLASGETFLLDAKSIYPVLEQLWKALDRDRGD